MYEIVWKRMSFPINDPILEDPVAVSQVGRKGATKVLEKAFSPGLIDYTMPGLGMNFLFFFLSTPEQRTIFTVKKKRQGIMYV